MVFDLSAPKPFHSKLNIILWNFFPYLGVLFLGWAPLTVFVCYALETVVIGFFNVFKIIAVYYYGLGDVEGEIGSGFGVLSIPAFILTYGGLVYFQLCMFFALTGYVRQDGKPDNLFYSMSIFMDDRSTFLALAIFIVNNCYSFVVDFILPRQYCRQYLNRQMLEPFPRVVIIQAIVFGGVFVGGAFGYQIITLLIFTLLKILVELYLFKRQQVQDIAMVD